MPATKDHPAQNVPKPVMPDKAKEFSAAGLDAFVRYWYDVLNYAQQTGDTSKLRELSVPECQECGQYADRIDKYYQPGGWLVGLNYKVQATDPKFYPNDPKQFADAIQFGVTDGQIRHSDGTVQDSKGVAVTSRAIFLQYDQGKWELKEIGQLS